MSGARLGRLESLKKPLGCVGAADWQISALSGKEPHLREPMKLAKKTASISNAALRDRPGWEVSRVRKTHAGCVNMCRRLVFGLLISLMAPLGGGQIKAGEFPQG